MSASSCIFNGWEICSFIPAFLLISISSKNAFAVITARFRYGFVLNAELNMLRIKDVNSFHRKKRRTKQCDVFIFMRFYLHSTFYDIQTIICCIKINISTVIHQYIFCNSHDRSRHQCTIFIVKCRSVRIGRKEICNFFWHKRI